MVRVVADDADAAPLRHRLETPPRRTVGGDRRRRFGGVHPARDRRRRDGSRRIQHVVAAGQRYRHLHRGGPAGRPQREAGSAASRPQILRPPVGAFRETVGRGAGFPPERGRPRIVRAHQPRARRLREEPAEAVVQPRGSVEMLHVVVLDVRHQRQMRRIRNQRPVAFVRLDDQPRRRPAPRRRAVRRQLPADAPRRLPPRRAQDARQHRGGRRLAVGPRHRQRRLARRHRRQHVAAAERRNPPRRRRRAFGMLRRERGRIHHPIRPAGMRRIVPRRGRYPLRPKPIQRARRPRVAPRHPLPHPRQEPREPGHADAADPHHVHARPRCIQPPVDGRAIRFQLPLHVSAGSAAPP